MSELSKTFIAPPKEERVASSQARLSHSSLDCDLVEKRRQAETPWTPGAGRQSIESSVWNTARRYIISTAVPNRHKLSLASIYNGLRQRNSRLSRNRCPNVVLHGGSR